MVLPVRIELTTSALPRMRSTTELRQHYRLSGRRGAYGRWPRMMSRRGHGERTMSAPGGWPRRCARICSAARRRRARRANAAGAGRAPTAREGRAPGTPRSTRPRRMPACARQSEPLRAARSLASSQACASPSSCGPTIAQHLGVIGVDPGALVGRQQRRIDQAAVDRREGQRLEAEHLLLRAGDLARLDQHQILDADAVFAGLVIAGLVGEDHARPAAARRRRAARCRPGEMRCGPSCTARKLPTPWPVPWA